MDQQQNELHQTGSGIAKLDSIFDSAGIDESSPHSREIQLSIVLARHLQRRANELQTPQERRQQSELDRMIQSPSDKVTMIQMTDQAFRAKTPNRAVDQLVHILDVQGIPRFFTPFDRALLMGFQSFGSYLPGVAVPMVKGKMQQETANVVLPAEQELLAEHLQARRKDGMRMNVNFLGEALIGEDDAQSRLKKYLQAMQNDDIEVMSVKISTIYSQISSLAYDHTLDILCDRLELLFRASAKATFTRADGSVVPKFVYLDMEEYRDMRLTADAFERTLSRPGLESLHAGIVLQAYIPDSFATQQRLVAWARERVAAGGAPITMRIVKGANMEMERFEASLHCWPQAPYTAKVQTDANYRRMVDWGLQPENIAAAHLGIASHNLFEVAYGIVKAIAAGALDKVQFEMLEGMANHQRRALQELVDDLLLYAPACRKEDFIHAIGYLVRRLDENTGPSNFLRHAFKLKVDSEDWEQLEQQFCDAFDELETLSQSPRRTQDRNADKTEPPEPAIEAETPWQEFKNEADTDFTLPQNVKWAEQVLSDWQGRHSENAIDIPLVVAGETITDTRKERHSSDPSRPELKIANFKLANASDVDAAVACAKRDSDGWRAKSFEDRSSVLRKVAQTIRQRRADLMGAALVDGGKTLPQSDPEVSEAIDFVEFYTRTASYFENLPGVTSEARGVVVVVSPWNFPIAIPCGGVAAALAAGNTVILKPASDTVLIAHELCKCFWDAGVSQETLQLLPCSGATEGQQLATHADVDTVILTGGTETALSMLAQRPDMRLLAETGGKNATIVTAMSDRDQAIKNVIQSAFGHAGQKCSATSLLILEGEVYEDEKFKATLCDAVRSMGVGSAWDLETSIGPLIRPPSGELETSLKELEQGESWAVMPKCDSDNRQLYSPAVKWGVASGSFTHCTEFFGPVLAVMRADNLRHAIELVNHSGYGLTSGLESLDEREQEIWKDEIRAGNLYINRGTTGAVVLRQPFGGMGKSAFGPGIKAGGPNYVAQLMKFEDRLAPTSPSNSDDSNSISDKQLLNLKSALAKSDADWASDELRARFERALPSFATEVRDEFGRQHDHMRLVGQDNFRRYLPVRELRIRIDVADSPIDILLRVAAARSVGCRVTLSFASEMDSASAASQLLRWLDEATESWAADIEFVEESDAELAVAIKECRARRLRYADADRVPEVIRRSANENDCYIADAAVLSEGRVELLWYLEEQSISDNYHRYGNLGARVDEQRSPVA